MSRPTSQPNSGPAAGVSAPPARASAKLVAAIATPITLAGAALVRWDLDISQRVVDPGSSWASWIERYGELPGLFVGVLGVALIFANLDHLARWKRVGFACTAALTSPLLVLLIASLIAPQSFRLRPPYESSELILLGVSVAVALLGSGYFWRTERFGSRRVRRFARASVVMLIFGNVLILLPLKALWGRVRYRDLAANHADFSAWPIPQGFTGNFSFPSGHTSLAWLVLPLILLVPRESRALRWLVGAALVLWALAVGLSRVRLGAHYASDVLAASVLQILVFWGATRTLPPDLRVERRPLDPS